MEFLTDECDVILQSIDVVPTTGSLLTPLHASSMFAHGKDSYVFGGLRTNLMQPSNALFMISMTDGAHRWLWMWRGSKVSSLAHTLATPSLPLLLAGGLSMVAWRCTCIHLTFMCRIGSPSTAVIRGFMHWYCHCFKESAPDQGPMWQGFLHCLLLGRAGILRGLCAHETPEPSESIHLDDVIVMDLPCGRISMLRLQGAGDLHLSSHAGVLVESMVYIYMMDRVSWIEWQPVS